MILAIGTVTADLFVSGMEVMPTFGGDEFTASSLSFCDSPLTISMGGNGGNTAYVLGSLGAEVALGGAVGRDALGTLLKGWLTERGVNTGGLLEHAAQATASNLTIIDGRLNRFSLYHPGANHHFTVDDLPPALLEAADAVLFSGPSLLPGFRPEGLHHLLRTARLHGAITAVDIGPALGTPVTLAEMRPLLPVVDYLIANEHEITQYAGAAGTDAAIDATLGAGGGAVLLTRGIEGATLIGKSGTLTAKAVPLKPANTIGAGDSFNAGFLFALAQGRTTEQALAFGNATAGLVLESGQGVRGAPDAAAVEARL